jgi:hypothetical protein
MDREAFEQLVSEWLDQPERGDLRARIDAAAAGLPAQAAVKDEWLRLDRLVRDACPSAGRVDWRRFRQRVAERLESAPIAARVDERLRALTVVAPRVDWPRLRRRISAAVAGADRDPRVVRLPRRRVAAAGGLLAAAAALVFMLTLPTKPATAPTGFAWVRVSAPAVVWGRDEGRRPFARVTVSASQNADEAIRAAESAAPGARQPQPGGVFLMIEPVRLAAETRGGLIPFGFK